MILRAGCAMHRTILLYAVVTFASLVPFGFASLPVLEGPTLLTC
jgi:hypothetical protein